MTVAVRLPEDLENDLRRLAERSGHTLSDCVREACVAYIAEKQAASTVSADFESDAFRLGKHLFGSAASGEPARWQQRRQLIRDQVAAKHVRRTRPH